MMTLPLLLSLFRRLPDVMLLALLPYPLGPMARRFGYREGANEQQPRLQFSSLGNFVCMAHLIAAGWLVGLLGAADAILSPSGRGSLPMRPVVWGWLAVLVLTLAVLAFRVDRYVLFLLLSWLVTSGLLLLVLELSSRLPIAAAAFKVVCRIPVAIEWGVPLLLSLSLGVLYAGAATWAQLNDRWSIPQGMSNEIHHHNFERRDRSIYRPGRTFVADFPCLLRKYLYFGYGNIEIRNSSGRRMDLIEGVLFAEYYARRLVRDQLVHTRGQWDEADALLDELDQEDEVDACASDDGCS